MDIDKMMQDLGYWIYIILSGLVGVLYFLIRKVIPFVKPLFTFIVGILNSSKEIDRMKEDISYLKENMYNLTDFFKDHAKGHENLVLVQETNNNIILDKLNTILDDIKESKKDIKLVKEQLNNTEIKLAIHEERRASTNSMLKELKILVKETNNNIDEYEKRLSFVEGKTA